MGASTSSVTIPATGTYDVDPDSTRIGFTARHLFGLGPVEGTFRLRSGSVVVGRPVTTTVVVAAVETGSFASGNALRDVRVRSADVLDAEHHPEIVFASTGVSETDQGWVLRGEITARGVIAPVELTVLEVATDGDVVTVRVTGTVDRYAHGLTAMRGLAGRYLTLDIAARAVRN